MNIDRTFMLVLIGVIALDAYSNFKLGVTISEYKESYDNLNNIIAAQKLIKEVNDESTFD